MNKVILLILDGFGIAPAWGGNAIALAKMENWQEIWHTYPHSELVAHGQSVGLPGNEIGNSEVGHLTIGSGRVIPQDSTKINQLIENNKFYENKYLIEAFQESKQNNKPVHLIGLLTDTPVHASIDHLEALIKMAKLYKAKEVYIHLITDGRDTGPEQGIYLLERIESMISQLETGTISSISGRYFGMDRDNNWSRIKKVTDCLLEGKGNKTNSPRLAFSSSYKNNLTDEYIPPTSILNDNDQPAKLIEDGDPIIFFNFRNDRARQLSDKLLELLPKSKLYSFIPYKNNSYKTKNNFISIFETETIKNGLAEWLSIKDVDQLHIAETEKYAHVTYFFNSGIETPLKNESRKLIPSSGASRYNDQPNMKADKISQSIINGMNKKYQFILANFANADMVGHTGDIPATIKSLEFLDLQIGQILNHANQNQYYTCITADHGNAEEMVDYKTGQINPEHTKNLVPFIIVPPDNCISQNLKAQGSIADIAPTVLDLMGIDKPDEMTGQNLLI